MRPRTDSSPMLRCTHRLLPVAYAMLGLLALGSCRSNLGAVAPDEATRIFGGEVVAARRVALPFSPKTLVDEIARGTATTLVLPLVDGDVELEALQLRPIGANHRLIGNVRGAKVSVVSLAIVGDTLRGHLVVDGEAFLLRAEGPGRVLVAKIDPRTIPKELAPRIPAKPGVAHHVAGTPAAAPTKHRVLVVYTAEVAAYHGSGLGAWIDTRIDESNQAYADSGIQLELELAHHALLPDNDTETDSDALLSRMEQTNDGHFDDTHRMRDRHAADLVVLLRGELGDACGIANLAVISSDADDDSAFAVVDAISSCEIKFTFTHELGHIAGAHHDAANDPSGPIYAHGHVAGDEAWRTMMAYDDRCDTNPKCPRQLRFSNPGQTHADGQALGDSNSDNARRVDETAVTLEGFRIDGPRIGLYEGNDGTQDHVCVVSTEVDATYDFTGDSNTRYCDSDEARSAILFDVPAGRTVRMFDSPRGDTQDDWVEIVTKRDVTELLVPSLERDFENDDVRVIYHRNNGLDGKISRLQVMSDTEVATIDLHEGNGGTQNLVCTLPIGSVTSVRFPGHGACDNDEARSATLRQVRAGTVLRVFDDPEGDRHDDWTEIEVKRDIGSVMLRSFEAAMDGPDLKVTHHHHNGLDGKVSQLEVVSAPSKAAFQLFEGNDGGQTPLCHVPVAPGTAFDFTREQICDNDEARSGVLVDVPAGTVILAYDSPGGDRQDDWTAIEVMRDVDRLLIGSFERDRSDADVRVAYLRNNGLDGKLSRLEFTRSDALTGIFSLYEGNRGTQNKVCDIDTGNKTLRFKSSGACDNDEARSLTMTMVPPGVVLELYDHPDCGTSDDWVSIETERAVFRRTIDSLETSFADEDVTVTFHRKNGLDGKVSCAKVRR